MTINVIHIADLFVLRRRVPFCGVFRFFFTMKTSHFRRHIRRWYIPCHSFWFLFFFYYIEASFHCISQNGSLLVTSLLVCSWSWLLPPSLFGLAAPSSREPPLLPWGHIDCHLSARVDTIGGRDGLLSSILSISFIMLVLSFGMSCE